MNLTYLDSNSWLIEIEDQRILLDPWIVGKLVFGNLPWLFLGKKNKPTPIPENIDLILLSQGLEDHAHTPTLKELDHNIPVVASPNATKVVQELGYTNVTCLDHGESFTLADRVEIKAVPGSPIGPTLVENGYILRGLTTQKTLYYEPHGYHSPSLQEVAPIDVVVTPIISLKLPLVGAIIKGQKSALEVCQWLKPQFILSTAAGGDVSFEGLLISLLKEEGSVQNFKSLLEKNKLTTKAIAPQSGETYQLEIKS
ncbi:MAG: MBL fold metallo-hydrolase [Xenococcaceae cyanobacterium MO_188.B29]|nr:MBL fold metallo-hydrolase [Xenococcaceae cyanobacterium MO_188.B29]